MDSVSSNDQEQQVFSKDDLVYTYKSLKQDRDQFQDSMEGNCFDFFLTVSNYSYFCERRGVF